MVSESQTPAWMLCEDIITRLKDELILQAVDILHEEMKAGRIDISGYVSLLPDKPSELQKDMYIIGNLIQREHEIRDQYMPHMDTSRETDPDKLKRIEDLRKFMLSVGAISILMKLSEMAGSWADDTGKFSKLTDKIQILAGSARLSAERTEVIDYVLTSTKFLKSEALKQDEIELLIKAKELISGR